MTASRQDLLRYLKQLAEDEPVIILDKLAAPPPIQANTGLNRASLPAGGSSTENAVTVQVPLPRVEKLFSDLPEELTNLDLEGLGRKASTCELCELSKTRRHVVFGVGDPHARLMLIGEAPGEDEDAQGEPFVGRAGQLLNKILAAMKLERSEVYIANVLKCRPPGNRKPSPHEAASCLPYLRRQIELISPQVVVGLGQVAAVYLLGLSPTTSVKSLRERILNLKGRPLVVTYHPAALLRNPSLKGPTWEDMQVVMKLLSGEMSWHPDASGSGVFPTD